MRPWIIVKSSSFSNKKRLTESIIWGRRMLKTSAKSYLVTRKKKWFSWKQKLRLVDTTWRFRWTKNLSSFKSKSTCTLLILSVIKALSADWLSRRVTQLRNCVALRTRPARQWNSLRLTVRHQRPLVVVLEPQLLLPQQVVRVSQLVTSDHSIKLLVVFQQKHLLKDLLLVFSCLDSTEILVLSQHLSTQARAQMVSPVMPML